MSLPVELAIRMLIHQPFPSQIDQTDRLMSGKAWSVRQVGRVLLPYYANGMRKKQVGAPKHTIGSWE